MVNPRYNDTSGIANESGPWTPLECEVSRHYFVLLQVFATRFSTGREGSGGCGSGNSTAGGGGRTVAAAATCAPLVSSAPSLAHLVVLTVFRPFGFARCCSSESCLVGFPASSCCGKRPTRAYPINVLDVPAASPLLPSSVCACVVRAAYVGGSKRLGAEGADPPPPPLSQNHSRRWPWQCPCAFVWMRNGFAVLVSFDWFCDFAAHLNALC